MLAVAVAQAVYEMTRSPLHLGLIGLTFFLPKIILVLPAGHLADRFDRRAIILICRSAHFLLTLALVAFFLSTVRPLGFLYFILSLIGIVLAFDGPAMQSIVPHLVPEEHFSNAVTWNTAAMQAALMTGPLLGGWFYALKGPLFVLSVVAFLRFSGIFITYLMQTRTGRLDTAEFSWKALLGGLHYVFEKKLILGTISLDLFAVLFGGATALMPIYANDILKVGPGGLGILRSAPFFGAMLMSFILAHAPPLKRSGAAMLFSVALFGLFTILFGISTNFIFSLVCLVLLGATDTISVIIRHTLVQLKTPPEMRGRVSAVNLVFIGASNELGEFESGLTASWFGIVPSVILGGLATITVVALWTRWFPEVRRYET